MSEEVKIKISQPMFEVGELEVFDNNIHSIVEKYSKMQLHEKEQILTQRIIIKQEEEIEDLQNKLQQKENIIKEVRELVEGRKEHIEGLSWVEMKVDDYIEEQDELLEILDKAGDSNERNKDNK